MQWLCRQGLSHIMDNVSEYYNTTGLSHQDNTPDKSCLHDSVFVSPTALSLPVAKIIPLLSSQVRSVIARLSPPYSPD